MKSKKLFIIITIITIIIPVFLLFYETMVVGATGGIQYVGTISYGGTTVGNFRVDGVQAFCFEHKKPTPLTGTTNDGGTIYDDPRIAGALYYGWGGPGNIFTDFNQGVVITSLLVSRYYSGDTSGENLPGYAELQYRAENDGASDDTFYFSKTNVETFMTGNVQRSEYITFQADSANLISYNVPSEVTFHNVTTGYTQTGGQVTLAGGETFYLSSSLTYSTSFYSGEIKGSLGKYVPIVYVTPANLQNLGLGKWVGKEQIIDFRVNFRQFTHTVTVNHIDRVSGAFLKSDRVEVSIGETATFYPRHDFIKDGDLYKVLDEPKSVVVNSDEMVNFYYDPPIKIYLNHRDGRMEWSRNLILQEVVILYPDDPYYFVHRTDLKKGEYKYRPTSDNLYIGKVGVNDMSFDFFYDTPLVDIGMDTLRIYTAEASSGLPVELYVEKTSLYEETVADMGTGEIEINLYDGDTLLESRIYSALNLPNKINWIINPEGLLVNDCRSYTVKFENFNSNDFLIKSGRAEITTDGYTATEEEVIVSDKEVDKLSYEAVIMTEKKFDKKEMVLKKESFEVAIEPIKRMKTGYGFTNGMNLNYTNELNDRLTGYEVGFSFITPKGLLDSHLDYATDETNLYVPLENMGDSEKNNKNTLTQSLKYELPHVNVERKTGALFSDGQVASGDERITRELRDGMRKFYLPFWMDLGSYDVSQNSNGRLGVNKIKTVVKQDLEVFAYMYAHMNSPSIEDDAILMIPIDMENPFGGKVPKGWTESDIKWIKAKNERK